MTSYTAILNGEIDPESPITTSLVTKLRDNPIAIAEGATGAPRFSRKAIAPGGSGDDGALGNATTLTGIGYFDFSSWSRSSALTVPIGSVIRVDGNLTMSANITVGTSTAAARAAFDALGWGIGKDAAAAASSDGGGGGSAGSGGTGGGNVVGGTGWGSIRRAWGSRIPILGGDGTATAPGTAGAGGGGLVIMVAGNADFTGCTITASGAAGSGSGGGGAGGGGGGSIIIVCTGTITGGTFTAAGGAGGDSGAGDGGGGGGGYVALIASAYSGVQTISVAAGTASNTSGSVGVSETLTLTEPQINALVLR